MIVTVAMKNVAMATPCTASGTMKSSTVASVDSRARMRKDTANATIAPVAKRRASTRARARPTNGTRMIAMMPLGVVTSPAHVAV